MKLSPGGPLSEFPKVGLEVQVPDGQNAQLRSHWG